MAGLGDGGLGLGGGDGVGGLGGGAIDTVEVGAGLLPTVPS